MFAPAFAASFRSALSGRLKWPPLALLATGLADGLPSASPAPPSRFLTKDSFISAIAPREASSTSKIRREQYGVRECRCRALGRRFGPCDSTSTLRLTRTPLPPSAHAVFQVADLQKRGRISWEEFVCFESLLKVRPSCGPSCWPRAALLRYTRAANRRALVARLQAEPPRPDALSLQLPDADYQIAFHYFDQCVGVLLPLSLGAREADPSHACAGTATARSRSTTSSRSSRLRSARTRSRSTLTATGSGCTSVRRPRGMRALRPCAHR